MNRPGHIAGSLIAPLSDRAASRTGRPAVIFIGEKGGEETISVSQFYTRTVSHSRHLAALGIQSDDVIILVLEHGPALLYAFWGAVHLGAVPSIFPLLNEKLDPEFYLKQVNHLVETAGAKAVIVGEKFNRLSGLTLDWEGCQVITLPEKIGTTGPEEDDLPLADYHRGGLDKIAFLQHSSGTTGLQKGVALSHRSVLNQLENYSRAIGLHDDDVIVSWLPLYHDMGLIAGFVMPLVLGIPLVLMSPFYWVRDPKKLLLAAGRHGGTLCWLPNFAYNHMARAVRPRDLEGLDLSNVRMLINCSEPVRLDSHNRLFRLLGPRGLREESFAVCYAMAENTFAVTQTEPGKSPDVDWVNRTALQTEQVALPELENSANAVPLVSCGYPLDNNRVKVVDSLGRALPDRRIGEVAIQSDSMLSAYHRRPDLTSRALKDGWFYTGDLGYLAEGQLYITGRQKDLLIVGGKNIYPGDLEAIANDVDGIHPGRVVAFGVFDDRMGTEAVVMVCELAEGVGDGEKRKIEKQLRRAVVRATDVTLSDVYLVGEKWLIKTSSGKIARAENRARYLREGRLRVVP